MVRTERAVGEGTGVDGYLLFKASPGCICKINEDPTESLQHLPNLRFLELDLAYEGDRLCRKSAGFQRLKKLLLVRLNGLKSVEIEEGSMPFLQAPCIESPSSSAAACTAQTYLPSHSPSRSLLPFKVHRFAPPSSSTTRSPSIHCTLTKQQPMVGKEADPAAALQRPDSFGRFGKFGGKYVPETLMYALTELEAAFQSLATDHEFQKELDGILRDYVGRESPLYFAERLTEHYKRPDGKGLIFTSKGKTLITLGPTKSTMLLPKLYLPSVLCVIYMGAQDMERQSLNVFRMRLLGAEVRAVHSGTATLKDATSEAIRDWVTNVESTHYILGSVAGPHPYPMMVREFHAVIGKETRKQALEKWGGKPDVLVACVGGGSNAMGLFHEFVDDKDVRLIAFKRLSRLEGIIPALETSHALAYLEKLCPTLPDATKVVLNCSGRGDKDVQTAIKHLKL
ncbi:UNVERIFIED_CONTAM: Tryptophan synthase beta chain 2, chloroplastic [Sesamum calycinum]|uniref:tryptophan synthase n=1 Tax=Sesamum calycinum TaxID=2727403 RepID=A0AAW2Q5P1_9LAMI